MQIYEAAIDTIIPYEFNNRLHSKEQIDLIAKSIQEFGFNQPIVVDEQNTVLVGHGRLFAALSLRHKTIPALQVAGLSEAQKKAYRILDNKLQTDSSWAFDNLDTELGFLVDADFPIDEWGLDALRALCPEPAAPVTDDDFEPEDQTDIYIKLGDIIQLGRHVVLCGDSTDPASVDTLLSDVVPDLIVTDPPYGVNHIGGTKDPRRKTHRTGGVVINDNMGEDGTAELIKASLALQAATSKAGAVLYMTAPGGSMLPYLIGAMAGSFVFKHTLVWVKHAFVFSACDYHYRHEMILYGWKDDGAHYFINEHNQDTILEFDRGDKMIPHPTSKPLGLIAKLIRNSSKPGEVVSDPFLGSGTTLIASEQLGRTCYGMEIGPAYCQVVIDRYKAYCTNHNMPFDCKINGESFSGKNG